MVSSTIGQWLKSTLSSAGIDTSVFQPTLHVGHQQLQLQCQVLQPSRFFIYSRVVLYFYFQHIPLQRWSSSKRVQYLFPVSFKVMLWYGAWTLWSAIAEWLSTCKYHNVPSKRPSVVFPSPTSKNTSFTWYNDIMSYCDIIFLPIKIWWWRLSKGLNERG